MLNIQFDWFKNCVTLLKAILKRKCWEAGTCTIIIYEVLALICMLFFLFYPCHFTVFVNVHSFCEVHHAFVAIQIFIIIVIFNNVEIITVMCILMHVCCYLCDHKGHMYSYVVIITITWTFGHIYNYVLLTLVGHYTLQWRVTWSYLSRHQHTLRYQSSVVCFKHCGDWPNISAVVAPVDVLALRLHILQVWALWIILWILRFSFSG